MPSFHNYKFINILNHQKFIPICLGIFILLRLVPMIFLPVTPLSDSGWYLSRAIDLMNGLGYQEGGYPTAYWPVGYPGFLAAIFTITGASVLVAQLVNLLASIGSFFLILALSRKLFKEEHVGRISILIITFYPNNIFYNSLLLTETLYTFILLGSFYLFLLYNNKALVTLTGIAFGLATLIKTQTLLIPFIPLFITMVVYWIKDKKFPAKHILTKGIFIALGMTIIIGPWSYRNYQTFDSFVLVSTNGGQTLLTGNHPNATGDYSPDNNPLAKQLIFGNRVQDQISVDQQAKKLALNWIKKNPMAFIKLMPKKIWRLWAPDGESEWAYQRGYANYDAQKIYFRAMRYFNQAYYSLILLTSIIGMVLLAKNFRTVSPWVTLGLLYCLYTTLISMVFSGQSRFHAPAMVFLIMYTSYAICYFKQLR